MRPSVKQIFLTEHNGQIIIQNIPKKITQFTFTGLQVFTLENKLRQSLHTSFFTFLLSFLAKKIHFSFSFSLLFGQNQSSSSILARNKTLLFIRSRLSPTGFRIWRQTLAAAAHISYFTVCFYFWTKSSIFISFTFSTKKINRHVWFWPTNNHLGFISPSCGISV